MRSYEAARGMFDRMETFANIVTAIGVISAVIGGLAGASMLHPTIPGILALVLCALPGSFIAMYGSSALVNAQMGRASVDCAEYAQLSLSVSRQQLELAQEALALSKGQSHPYYASKLAKAAAEAAVLVANPNASPDGSEQPSYADRSFNRSETDVAGDVPVAAKIERDNPVVEAAQTTPQLEHKMVVPLAGLDNGDAADVEPISVSSAVSTDVAEPSGDTAIVYHDGQFLVGGKPFKTKDAALAYKRDLQAKETS